jgi:hypothetical protein
MQMKAISIEEPSRLVQTLTGAILGCGGWVLSRGANDTGTVNMLFEFERQACVEIYSVLIAAGLELSQSGHIRFTELCQCTRSHQQECGARLPASTWRFRPSPVCAYALSGGRSDLLGVDASCSSPAQRPGRRPAHAPRGWMVGARRLDSFWARRYTRRLRRWRRYSPDLSRDRFHVWLSKYHWIPITVSGLLLLRPADGRGEVGVNGVAMVLWGVLLRVTLGLHATWLVNSATHLWGSRRFETRDDSRNNWWVALLTGGEGWHNNHHAHPVSARHGLAWYEVDPNFWGIWLLAKLGLARKIQVAKFDKENPKPAGA